MTTQEFSAAFDTLLNSYNSKANFGETTSKSDIVLDEYEKSVFLTQAQDIVIKSYFNKNTNPQGEGIDDSTRRQVDFSSLITVKEMEAYSSSNTDTPTPTNTDANTGTNNAASNKDIAFDSRGILYETPDNLLVILNEKYIIADKSYVVVPINYEEYDRLMSKAYAQPLKKQCWRLFHTYGKTLLSEIIPRETTEKNVATAKYKIRYVKRPCPIVLTDLNFNDQETLQINGISKETDCELNSIVHMDILNKAFELAIISKTGRLPVQEK